MSSGAHRRRGRHRGVQAGWRVAVGEDNVTAPGGRLERKERGRWLRARRSWSNAPAPVATGASPLGVRVVVRLLKN